MAKVTNVGVHIVESSAAISDTGGESQIWVKSDTPSSLYHTDDAGNDHRMGGITLGTEVTPTGVTVVDYTSIPPAVRRIVIAFEGLSTDGAGKWLIQIGDSGGIETSGYVSQAWAATNNAATSTAGFVLNYNSDASYLSDGLIWLQSIESTGVTWVSASQVNYSSGYSGRGTGRKTLNTVLDRVRITTDAADDFDAGSVNISFD